MIAIKIQCGCGQKYSFETEPVDGRMGYAIACPICGADGTSAANTAIAQSLTAQPALVAAGGVPFQAPPPFAPTLATPALATAPAQAPVAPVMGGRPAPSRLMPGQIEKPQAETEARAKIFWGDAPEEVIKFLMIHGFTYPEASARVGEMFAERAVTIRQNGVKKIITGILMACLPVAGWFFGVAMISIKLFAFMAMIGLWGAYRLVKGTIMVIAPKSEPGDVSSQ